MDTWSLWVHRRQAEVVSGARLAEQSSSFSNGQGYDDDGAVCHYGGACQTEGRQ